MFSIDWITDLGTSLSSTLAEWLLVQANPVWLIVFGLCAIILLMVRISRPRPSYVVKVIAIIILMWVSINAGWFLRDNEWGVEEITYQRLHSSNKR